MFIGDIKIGSTQPPQALKVTANLKSCKNIKSKTKNKIKYFYLLKKK